MVVEVDERNGGGFMRNVIFDMSVSLDGFAKGATSNSRQRDLLPTVFPPNVTDGRVCLVCRLRFNSGIRGR